MSVESRNVSMQARTYTRQQFLQRSVIICCWSTSRIFFLKGVNYIGLIDISTQIAQIMFLVGCSSETHGMKKALELLCQQRDLSSSKGVFYERRAYNVFCLIHNYRYFFQSTTEQYLQFSLSNNLFHPIKQNLYVVIENSC